MLINTDQSRPFQTKQTARATKQRTSATAKGSSPSLAFCHPGSGPANPSRRGADESRRRERGVAARQGPSLNLKAPTPGSGALFPRVHGQIRLV